MSKDRHCEERSDEAIHASACGAMDCFASLAMTRPHGEERGNAARLEPRGPECLELPGLGELDLNAQLDLRQHGIEAGIAGGGFEIGGGIAQPVHGGGIKIAGE